jgi:hypothetical protein
MAKKILRLTERDLTRLVRRVIKEQFTDDDFEFNTTTKNDRGDLEHIHNDFDVLLHRKSSKQVQRALSNLSENVQYIAFPYCEYADFSNIDLCEYPDLRFVNVQGTPNNFEETQDGCYDDIGGGMYDFSHGE